MKQKLKILLIILSFIIVAFFLYATIITIGNQRQETVMLPKELNVLESNLKKETHGGSSVFFSEMSENEMSNCNAVLSLNMEINNDSITKTKKNLDNYVNSVNKRVNKIVLNEKCIDSLIIEVRIDLAKNNNNVVNFQRYRYSFPTK
jgi:hypothetical protein